MEFRKVEPNGGWFPVFKPALTQRSKNIGVDRDTSARACINGNPPSNREPQ
jgi:hypothetical protein